MAEEESEQTPHAAFPAEHTPQPWASGLADTHSSKGLVWKARELGHMLLSVAVQLPGSLTCG